MPDREQAPYAESFIDKDNQDPLNIETEDEVESVPSDVLEIVQVIITAMIY